MDRALMTKPLRFSAATHHARSRLRLRNAAPPSKFWRAGPAPQPQRNARAAATRCPVPPSAPLSHSRVDATSWHAGDVAPLDDMGNCARNALGHGAP
eukprot:7487043-Pyramimonas_sp.AAC.1